VAQSPFRGAEPEILGLLGRVLGGDDFPGRVKQHMKLHDVSYDEACRTVARDDPEGYKAYRNATFLDGQLK
jgi:hypothetical protein